MTVEFATEDLFIFGIGLDLVGALLLASATLMSPRQIRIENVAVLDFNALSAYHSARDRVRGWAAISLLSAGFALQAVGYLVMLGRAEVGSPGADRVIGGLLVLASAVVGGLLVDRLAMRWRLRPTIVRVARILEHEPSSPGPAAFLRAVGLHEWRSLNDESDDEYARRIFDYP